MKLKYDFFNIEHNIKPQQGRIIIAEPFLPGNYFNRAIVLLVEHSKEGSVGFILNKPVEYPIKEFINEFPDFETGVSIGGPVSTNLVHFIHTLGTKIPGSIQIKDNLYWGGDFDQLKKLIATGLVKPNEVRFFLGYSGWGEHQLEDEIEENSWLVSEIDVEKVMRNYDNLWEEMVEKAGGKYKLWSNFPEDPGLN